MSWKLNDGFRGKNDRVGMVGLGRATSHFAFFYYYYLIFFSISSPCFFVMSIFHDGLFFVFFPLPPPPPTPWGRLYTGYPPPFLTLVLRQNENVKCVFNA